MEGPNARHVGEDGLSADYGTLRADHLEVSWHAHREEGGKWIEFRPHDLVVKLNGVPLTSCNGVEINFDRDRGFPQAKLAFTLEKLDIDAETLMALQAYLKKQEGETPDGT